jgi:hypothetical protein
LDIFSLFRKEREGFADCAGFLNLDYAFLKRTKNLEQLCYYTLLKKEKKQKS